MGLGCDNFSVGFKKGTEGLWLGLGSKIFILAKNKKSFCLSRENYLKYFSAGAELIHNIRGGMTNELCGAPYYVQILLSLF